MSEANKELVRRRFEELFNRRNLDAADGTVDLTTMLQLGLVRPAGGPPS